MSIIRPGLKFFAEPMAYEYAEPSPKRGELYIVCKNGTINNVHNPREIITWSIAEYGDQFFYVIGHTLARCLVTYHSMRSEDEVTSRPDPLLNQLF